MNSPDNIVLRAALDATPIALLVLDYETELIHEVNETAIEQFGYTLEELKLKTLHDLCATGVGAIDPPTLDSGEIKNVLCTLQTKSGSDFPAEVTLRSKTLAGMSCTIATVRDVSERVLHGIRLDRIHAALDAVDEAVLVSDPDTKLIVTANQAAQRLFGATEKELTERRACEIDQTATPEEISKRVKHLLANPDEKFTLYRTVTHANGQQIPVEIVLSTITQHEKPYIVGVIRDITVRQKQDDLLRLAMAEAKEANEAKNEFLARISHELRTPLNAILGYSQILLSEVESVEHKQNLEHIIDGGSSLLKLIEEVLDLSQIESKEIALDIHPIGIDEAVSAAVALIGPSATERNVVVAVSGESSLVACADQDRLTQVLLNVLSNAVKYNVEGGRIEIVTSTHADNMVEIVVSDTGIGIGPKELKRVGTPFDRLGAQTTNVQGTGLGLTITQSILTAMGGEFAIESTVGEGTTVTVRLPVSTEARSSSQAICGN